MDFADTFLDRRMLSTDTNEYATGLLDENEWRENIMDYDISFDLNEGGDYDGSFAYGENSFVGG